MGLFINSRLDLIDLMSCVCNDNNGVYNAIKSKHAFSPTLIISDFLSDFYLQFIGSKGIGKYFARTCALTYTVARVTKSYKNNSGMQELNCPEGEDLLITALLHLLYSFPF